VGRGGDDYITGSRLDTVDELNLYNRRNNLFGNNQVTLENVYERSMAGLLVGDSIFGGLGNDELNGYYGNDYLDGGAGADVMMGWDGNDTYVVDNSGDYVVEYYDELGSLNIESPTNGIDTILTSLTSLDLRDNRYFGVENVTAAIVSASDLGVVTQTNQTASVNFIGSALDNILTGGNGNDTLNGGGGSNLLIGGAGNDWLEVTNDLGTPNGVNHLIGGIGDDTYVVDVAGVAVIVDRGAGEVIKAKGYEFRAAYSLSDLGL
jgi:Ca2+-binding RTX toxin-like protein